jgi:hypothetical protein
MVPVGWAGARLWVLEIEGVAVSFVFGVFGWEKGWEGWLILVLVLFLLLSLELLLGEAGVEFVFAVWIMVVVLAKIRTRS